MVTVALTPLAEFLARHIGTGRRFESARQLSLAAGLNPGTVGLILAGRSPEADTVIRLAQALGLPRVRLFQVVGWLRPGDIREAVTLTEDEQEWLRVLRLLPPELRRVLLAVARQTAEPGEEAQRTP